MPLRPDPACSICCPRVAFACLAHEGLLYVTTFGERPWELLKHNDYKLLFTKLKACIHATGSRPRLAFAHPFGPAGRAAGRRTLRASSVRARAAAAARPSTSFGADQRCVDSPRRGRPVSLPLRRSGQRQIAAVAYHQTTIALHVPKGVQHDNVVNISSKNMGEALNSIVDASAFPVSATDVLTASIKSDEYKNAFVTLQRGILSI